MKLRSLIFLLVALAQVGAPAYLILRQEETLAKGRVLKFKTAPVDPVDVLRGRYVALRFQIETVPDSLVDASIAAKAEKHPVSVYATFAEDASGEATVASLSDRKPSGEDAPFVQVSLHHRGWRNSGWQIDLPFNRFYMEEHAAPHADLAYRQNTGAPGNAYALVALHGGNTAIKDLCIDDMPIQDYLKAHPPGK